VKKVDKKKKTVTNIASGSGTVTRKTKAKRPSTNGRRKKPARAAKSVPSRRTARRGR
jgi:hypothetical protein